MNPTPIQNCDAQHHTRTRHSPNAIDIIEECEECHLGFLFNSSLKYPVTLWNWPQRQTLGLPYKHLKIKGH